MKPSRHISEQLGLVIRKGLAQALGEPVDFRSHGEYDDPDLWKLAVPISAALVAFTGELADCLVVVSTMEEEHLSAAATSAAIALADAAQAPDCVMSPDLYAWPDRDLTAEHLEALVGEMVMRFDTPRGDVLVILGGELVRACRARVFELAAGRGDELPDLLAQHEHTAAALIRRQNVTAGSGRGPATDAEVDATLSTPVAVPVELPSFDPADVVPIDHGGWSDLLTGVSVAVTAELGSTDMRLGEIASLDRDFVVTLDQTLDEPVKVYVNGMLFATARLVVVDDEYGLEIIDVVASLAPGIMRSEAAA